MQVAKSFKLSRKVSKILIPFFEKLSTKGDVFSLPASSVIMNSREEAFRLGTNYIELEHMFLAIIKVAKSRAVEILLNLGCDLDKVKRAVEDSLRLSRETMTIGKRNIPFSKRAENALKQASEIAGHFNCDKVKNEHLLLAILKEESSPLISILQTFNVTYDNCYNQLKELDSN